MDSSEDLVAILHKRDNFCDFLYAYFDTSPFWKRAYSKREQILSL